jgi:hypothetical protein
MGVKRLKAVAADRGFYSQTNEKWLKKGGIKTRQHPGKGQS